MLYNIISPLVFFGSLSGVIVIVSRVMARGRKHQHSAEVLAEGQKKSQQEAAEVLRPSKKGIRLAKNQAAALLQSARQLKQNARQAAENRFKRRAKTTPIAPLAEKAAPAPQSHQTIMAPRSGWRERAAAAANQLKTKAGHGFAQAKNWRARRREAALAAQQAAQSAALAAAHVPLNSVPEKKPHPKPAPRIRVRQVTPQESAPAPKQVRSQLVTPIFFKRSPKPNPIRLAQDALEKQEYQEVENILVPYIMENAKDVTAYIILGQAALKLENWSEAAEIFDQVIALNPQEPGIQALLGQAAFRAGRYGQALLHLQRALDETPDDKEILRSLVKVAHTMDNQPLLKAVQAKLSALTEEPAAAAKSGN